ncbi:MAG: SCO family protein, partial [Planctomycetota bacterium]
TRFDPSFIGVSGEPPRVRQVLADWGVKVERQERADGSYVMAHPAFIVMLNRSGAWQLTTDYLAPAEEVAADVRHLVAQVWDPHAPVQVADAPDSLLSAAASEGGAAARRRATTARGDGAFYLAFDDGAVAEVDSVTGEVRRMLLRPWSEAPSPDPTARDGALGAREVAFDPVTRLLWYADTHEFIRSIHVDSGEPGPELTQFSDAALPGCGVANAARHVSIDLARRRLIVPVLTGAVLFYDLETAKLVDAIGPAFFGSDLVLGGFRHFSADPATDSIWYATSRGDLVEMSTASRQRTGRIIRIEEQEDGARNAYREMVIEPTRRVLIYQTRTGRLASFDLLTLERIDFAGKGVLGSLENVGSIAYDPARGGTS